MNQHRPANRMPLPLAVEKDHTYYWCSCGMSSTQPFCDGSHKDSSMAPVAYTATRDQIVFFCGCKQSRKGPVCDGTHSRLPKSSNESPQHGNGT
ncbi:MAG: glutamate synthase [Gammaproteobacteria bacterium HGW-Gammaproteobacteria-14]|nr:MAG: glutamate synthase [Gammaproteobacteria bacterium HGW-Gammaproteobacteria-14]